MEPAGRPPSRPVSFPLSLRRARSAPRGFTCARGTPDLYLGFGSGRKGSRFLLPAVRPPARSRSAEPGEPLGCGAWQCPEVWFSSPGERGFTGHRAFPGPGRGALPSHPQRCLDISPIQGKAAGLTLKPLRRRRLLPAVPITMK